MKNPNEKDCLLDWLTHEMHSVLPVNSTLFDMAPHLAGCERLLGTEFGRFFVLPAEVDSFHLRRLMRLVVAARAWIVLDDAIRDGDSMEEMDVLAKLRNHFEKQCISMLGAIIDSDADAENIVRSKIGELETAYSSLKLYQIPPDGNLILSKCSLLSLPFYALAKLIEPAQAERRFQWASDILFLLQLADDWFDMEDDIQRPWCGNLLTWQPQNHLNAESLRHVPLLAQVYAKAIIDTIAKNLIIEIPSDFIMLKNWLNVLRTKLGIKDASRCSSVVTGIFDSHVPSGYAVPSINPRFHLPRLQALIDCVSYDSDFRAEKLHCETTLDSFCS